jgi:hypothetical protein
MLQQRPRTTPTDLAALIEIPINRFNSGDDRTDLVSSQRIKRPHMRQAHQLISDLSRPRGQDAGAVDAMPKGVQVPRMCRNEVFASVHSESLPFGPDDHAITEPAHPINVMQDLVRAFRSSKLVRGAPKRSPRVAQLRLVASGRRGFRHREAAAASWFHSSDWSTRAHSFSSRP